MTELSLDFYRRDELSGIQYEHEGDLWDFEGCHLAAYPDYIELTIELGRDENYAVPEDSHGYAYDGRISDEFLGCIPQELAEDIAERKVGKGGVVA